MSQVSAVDSGGESGVLKHIDLVIATATGMTGWLAAVDRLSHFLLATATLIAACTAAIRLWMDLRKKGAKR